jgi:RNA recognition motif-containing protein
LLEEKRKASDAAEKKAQDKADAEVKKAKEEKKEVAKERKESKDITGEVENTVVPDESNLTAFQIEERKKRTCFIGNLPMAISSKQVKQLFKSVECHVEKVWFRSICLELESKLPTIKAKILTGGFGDQKDSKNGYVVLASHDQAKKACEELNQRKVIDKHIRVDLEYKENGDKSAHDYETTAFVGNLPFICNEETLREFILY